MKRNLKAKTTFFIVNTKTRKCEESEGGITFILAVVFRVKEIHEIELSFLVFHPQYFTVPLLFSALQEINWKGPQVFCSPL
jgi:hypothetical protein